MIAHLDCDAFYATVELIRRPELKGKPVIVAGSGPRAVVTTASYEARKFGVGSAMPASRARRLCPDAVVIPPDFTAYRDTSKAVWAIVEERLDRLQPMGLDEAYAELTGVPKPLRVLRELVEEVRTAFDALDGGAVQDGLDTLIGAIGSAPDSDRRDDLRRSVVGVLDELGVEHPVARDSRRKLASALY